MVQQKIIPSDTAAHAFWLNSRYRFEIWNRRLGDHRAAIDRPGTSHRTRKWYEVLPVLQEILLTEPLARCIGYIGRALDDRNVESDFSPLVHSIFHAHAEARHRCLNLVVFGHGLPVEQAVKLNRLRRSLETYNDQLLACLPVASGLPQFAFDFERVQQAQTRFSPHPFVVNKAALHLQSLSLALTRHLRHELDPRVVNARLNGKLTATVLSLLPAPLFDSFGVAKTSAYGWNHFPSAESNGNSADLSQPLEPPLDTLMMPSITERSRYHRRKRKPT